jgi:hypothetical protein
LPGLCVIAMPAPPPAAAADALLQPLTPSCGAVQRDRNRVAVLEWLYEVDGRDQPGHPRAHTYTGLAQQYQALLGRWLLEELTEAWHLEGADGAAASAGPAEG